MNTHKLIVIDDDINLANILREFLKKYGHSVDVFHNPKDGLNALKENKYDLLILDIMLPEMDGIEVCKNIRQFSSLPILFLSARGDTMDKILGLEIGGDDYLSKPFEPRELLARIDTILRRVQPSKKNIQTTSSIFDINTESMEVFKEGNKIEDLYIKS